MHPNEKRLLLGRFVRAHRERIAPDIATPRRRTPGLRREELAARAGIGVTWCAWIEQGREISISAHTLARLANALALTPAERAYLFELAGRRDPDAPHPARASPAPEALSAIVQSLSHPAYGLDPLWNACCWNDAAARLFVGWLNGPAPRNLLRFAFAAPSARTLLPDWENRARRILAEFRVDCARMSDDPALHHLVRELSAESPFFASEWDAQSVMARAGGLRDFAHPSQGLLRFRQYSFSPADRPEYKLVALMPVQNPSE